MDKKVEVSWIFMAIGYASQTQPADFAAISKVADGINHAVPSHKELQGSISLLLEKSLIEKQAKKYILSKSGLSLLESARHNSKTVFEVWKELENEFEHILQA